MPPPAAFWAFWWCSSFQCVHYYRITFRPTITVTFRAECEAEAAEARSDVLIAPAAFVLLLFSTATITLADQSPLFH